MGAAAVPKPKKKRPRWMVVAGSLLLFLCCLFAFLALRRSGLFPGPNQIAMQTIETPAPPNLNQTPLALPNLDSPGLIDDFEGVPPAGTAGWQAFFQDNADTELTCAANPDFAHSGVKSLQFRFNVAADSWATCGFYFDSVQNWSAGQGLSFYLRADRAGIPFHVDLYGGTPAAITTYYYGGTTTPESVDNWVLIEIRWKDILSADWQENPGMPFNPVEVTGFSVGLSTDGTERVSGTIWLDDLGLLGFSASAPDDNASPEIRDAIKGVELKPDDPFAHLRLAMAYWDAERPRLAYQSLNRAADLAGQDQAFLRQAAEQFARREAWIAAALMYQRALSTQPDGQVSVELLNQYHEAVYKASASSEDLALYLPFDIIAKVDEPIALIAEGRFNLHRGDNAKAREFLERARGSKPTMPEVTLLDAEIFIKEGKKDEARQLLEQLMANPNTPEWIRALADTYLTQNP